jgi:hypothetical protein
MAEQRTGRAAGAEFRFHQQRADRSLLHRVCRRTSHARTAIQQWLATGEAKILDQPVQRRRASTAPTGSRNLEVRSEFDRRLRRPFCDRVELGRHRLVHEAAPARMRAPTSALM